MSVNQGRKAGPFWGLVEQKGPWKSTKTDVERSHRVKPSKNTGGGIPIGGIKNAGHASWYASIHPKNDVAVLPPPPKPSRYVQKSIIQNNVSLPQKVTTGRVVHQSPVESYRPDITPVQRPGAYYQPNFFPPSEYGTARGGPPSLMSFSESEDSSINSLEYKLFEDRLYNSLGGANRDISSSTQQTQTESDQREQEMQTETDPREREMYLSQREQEMQNAWNQREQEMQMYLSQNNFNPIENQEVPIDTSSYSPTRLAIEDAIMTRDTTTSPISVDTVLAIEDAMMTATESPLPINQVVGLIDYIQENEPQLLQTSSTTNYTQNDFNQAVRDFQDFSKSRRQKPKTRDSNPQSEPSNTKTETNKRKPSVDTPNRVTSQSTGLSQLQQLNETMRALRLLQRREENLKKNGKKIPTALIKQILNLEREIKKLKGKDKES